MQIPPSRNPTPRLVLLSTPLITGMDWPHVLKSHRDEDEVVKTLGLLILYSSVANIYLQWLLLQHLVEECVVVARTIRLPDQTPIWRESSSGTSMKPSSYSTHCSQEHMHSDMERSVRCSLYVCLSLYISLSLCMCVSLSLSLSSSVCLSVSLSLFNSLYLCLSLSFCLCVSPHLSLVLFLAVYLSLFISVCPFHSICFSPSLWLALCLSLSV